MSRDDRSPELTDSLEDYLETVYELVRDHKFARVRDIAKARGVRPGSVSPAMRRLAELGLIEYERREYIGLTPAGEAVARRVVARHQILVRLLQEVLQMASDAAEADACAMEHSLSDEAVDRLVRFFEFLRVCPDAQHLLTRFHACSVVHDGIPDCEQSCEAKARRPNAGETPTRSLGDLDPGEEGTVTRIDGAREVRQRLLDMGIMPDVTVVIDRVAQVDDVIWVTLGGFQISLTCEEAAAVRVTSTR